jgi:serine/threonine protein kinase
LEGKPFGRYRLVELLGRGGMGEVWRAHDTRTDRIVAIKVLPPQFSDDPTFQERFRREAHGAARLDHPNVIPIHDYGEIDGHLYVDMRLIRGRDLQALIADGALQPGRAVRIIEQVAKALHAAHKVGLVHRDVKPSNILVDDEDFAYLIDFGIARATDDTRLTGTGNAIGTFQYMAPERMGGHPDDARADIYALACVLYECLTGQPPFPGTNMGSLVAAHLHTPPPQPSMAKADVPQQLDEVIATGMAKEPDQRYATTVELAVAAHDAVTTSIERPSPKPMTEPIPPETGRPASAANIRTDQPPPPLPAAKPSPFTPPARPPPPAQPPPAWRQPSPANPIAVHEAATKRAPMWDQGGTPSPLPEKPLVQRLSRGTKWSIGCAVIAIVTIAVIVISVRSNTSSHGGALVPGGTATSSRSSSQTTTSSSPSPNASPGLAGTWTGKSPYEDVELTINSPDRLDGNVTYHGNGTCTETWTEVGRTGSTIHVEERRSPGSNCGELNWDVTVDGTTLTAQSTWRSSGGSNSLTLTKTR